MDDEPPLELPIDGVLDLHTFRPSEAKPLIADYLEACRERGILSVRIIHGKGTGALRELVRAQLAKNPLVLSFSSGNETSGSWGATIVQLKPPERD
jgi:DNA-nicking Smr family endonuclease